MHRLFVWVLTCVFATTSVGCGTIISGRHQDVALSMNPPDTQVSVYRWSGELVAGPENASSGEMRVHRPRWNEPYLIQAAKEGHCPQYWLTSTKPSVGSWFIMPFVAAIMLFPLAGAIVAGAIAAVDASTGGCCSVQPDLFDGLLLEDAACTG